jgi:hypothetical protein
MSDQNKTHPKTRNLLDQWRIRSMRRSEAKAARRVKTQRDVKTATVIDVADNGDVMIDRMTDGDGHGEWLTPVNGRTPAKGQTVVVEKIEGSLAVMGAVGEGEWSIMPDPQFARPHLYVPEPLDPTPGIEIYDWLRISTHPFLSVNPMNPRVFFGAPPFFAPNFIKWYDHFTSGGVNANTIGEMNWFTGGSGNITYPANEATPHAVRLTSGATNGNRRIVCLGQATNHPLMALCANGLGAAYTEAWFVLKPGFDTSGFVQFGYGDTLENNPPTNAIYWRMDTTTPTTTTFYARQGGVVIHSETLPTTPGQWFNSGTVIFSIRIEPSTDGDESEGWNVITGTLWYASWAAGLGMNEDALGVGNFLIPGYEVRWKTNDMTLFYGTVGATVGTLANVNKIVDVDYMGGFYYADRILME